MSRSPLTVQRLRIEDWLPSWAAWVVDFSFSTPRFYMAHLCAWGGWPLHLPEMSFCLIDGETEAGWLNELPKVAQQLRVEPSGTLFLPLPQSREGAPDGNNIKRESDGSAPPPRWTEHPRKESSMEDRRWQTVWEDSGWGEL